MTDDTTSTTTPAGQLRAAAAKLRTTLPGDLTGIPRLVMTDAETISGIAFCVDHLLPRDVEHEFAACDHCEVIDCLYEPLAELVLALLAAREPLADTFDNTVEAIEESGVKCPPSVVRLARVIRCGAA